MRFGVCRLCGEERMLSFEHVPPQEAFNDAMVIGLDIKHLMARIERGEASFSDVMTGTKKIYQQRGSGDYTLCTECNSNTGSWYGAEYVDFTRALYRFCGTVAPGSGVSVIIRMRPLRVLKQILTMFCSACGPRFAERQSTIRRYLLNKDSRYYPHGIQLWAGLFDVHHSQLSRQQGLSGLISEGHEDPIYLAEISYPPFVYVMTTEGSNRPDERLQPITFMRDFQYAEAAEIRLNLVTLAVKGPYPGNYERQHDEFG